MGGTGIVVIPGSMPFIHDPEPVPSTSGLTKMLPDVILPSPSRSSKLTIYNRFPHQNSAWIRRFAILATFLDVVQTLLIGEGVSGCLASYLLHPP